MMDIISGRITRPRRAMVYGVHGVGKTTFAASAPSPILIQTEDGADDVGVDRFPISLTVTDVMRCIEQLFTEQHKYRTVILDSLDWLEPMIWASVVEQHGATKGYQSIEDFGYGKGYLLATSTWRQVLEGLQALRDQRDMHVVLVAHAVITRFENPETPGYDRYTPRLHKGASALVQEWCDEVLFATYRVYTREEAKGFGAKSVKGGGSGERLLKTEERPAHIAKNRLSLPYEMPLDWSVYASYFSANNGGK